MGFSRQALPIDEGLPYLLGRWGRISSLPNLIPTLECFRQMIVLEQVVPKRSEVTQGVVGGNKSDIRRPEDHKRYTVLFQCLNQRNHLFRARVFSGVHSLD